MGKPIISLGGLFMICPKCKFSNDATSAKFCPKCGFEYAKFHDIMIEKFTPRKKLIYTIILATCFVLSALGIVFFAIAMEKYFFGVFALTSLCLMNVLTAKVGVIDRVNTPKEIKGYVKFMSIVSMIINITNLIVLLLFVNSILFR